MSNTVTLSKHEMVVDRHHEITVVIEGGMCVDVRGLPEDWDYAIEDYDVEQQVKMDDIKTVWEGRYVTVDLVDTTTECLHSRRCLQSNTDD